MESGDNEGDRAVWLAETPSLTPGARRSPLGHRTRSAPSFISWSCAVDLSNRD
jgi:hypothetical protein